MDIISLTKNKQPMVYTAATPSQFWEIYQRDLFKFKNAASKMTNICRELDDAIHDCAISTYQIWDKKENKSEINIPAYLTYSIYSWFKNLHKQTKKDKIHDGYFDFLNCKHNESDEDNIGKYECPSYQLQNEEIERKIKLNNFFDTALQILKNENVQETHISIFKFYYIAGISQKKVAKITGFKLRTVEYAVQNCLKILRTKMNYDDHFGI